VDKFYKKKIDFLTLVFISLFAMLICIVFNLNYFFSSIIYFGAPSAYLSYKNPHVIKKIFLFSIALSLGIVMLDYMSILDKAWYSPNTILPFRLFGVVPIEDIIWGFFFVYLVISFYEHFIDIKKRSLSKGHLRYITIPIFLLFLFFLGIIFIQPGLLKIPYFYVIGGIVFLLVPVITILFLHPKLISKYLEAGGFFFVIFLLVEITSLRLKHWVFEGSNIIGWVEFLITDFHLKNSSFGFV
jgi:hypothetical protein